MRYKQIMYEPVEETENTIRIYQYYDFYPSFYFVRINCRTVNLTVKIRL